MGTGKADTQIGQNGTQRIRLVTMPGKDRDLLVDWLNSLARYEVRTQNPESGNLTGEPFDLCVVDPAGLQAIRKELLEAKAEADPVFLPCLLLGSEEKGTVSRPQSPDNGGPKVTLIDEVVSLPVEQPVLQRRIENLLHARNAALRLHQRQEQYEQLVRLTPEAIFIVEEGQIVYANVAAEETFLDEASGMLEGESLDRFIPEDERDGVKACLADIEQNGRVEEFREVTLQTMGGRPVKAELAGTTVTFGDEPAIQLLVRDITEKQVREQQLTLFARAIESTIQGVTIADANQDDNPLIYANEAFEEITGYSQAEILGRNCRFLQGKRTDQDEVDRLRHAIDAGSPVTVELLNYRKDGTPFWNQLDVLPITDGDGEITHYLGLQRDVSGRRAREERLQVLDRVLRHNLRNRMNVISGHADRLRDHNDDSVVEMAESIDRSATRLLKISEQIHQFGGLFDPQEAPLETIDIATLFEDIARDVNSDRKSLRVEIDCPATLSVGVSALFPAALHEFIDLAAQDNGSSVSGSVTLSASTTGEMVRIEVVDHDRTIPQAEFESLGEHRESPIKHPEGLETWLLRWAVANSDGDISISTGLVQELTLTFPHDAAATELRNS